MPTTIRCPNADCGQTYQVREESLGGRVKCKKCGTTFTVELKADETAVPKAGGSAAKPLPTARPLDDPDGAKGTPPTGPSPAAGAAPKKIGEYPVRRRLGGGAMGEVWLGWDSALQRNVAVKTLRQENTSNTHYLDRFLREARLAARLHHTNAVTVYQVGVDGTTAYIAMEYVEGQSLEEAVSPGKPMDWREATRAVRDAAAGLAAAHELDLVHRDIKPGNLMRTTKGVTKVVDFGLARAQAAQTQLTQKGSILGTPSYMAPELWRRKEADARSDLYALACTYYFLLTGEVPFDADNFAALGYQHTHEPLPDPRQRVPGLPDGVCRILAKGASKAPDDRYQSAAAMQEELDALLVEAASAGRESSNASQTLADGPFAVDDAVTEAPQARPAQAGPAVQGRGAAAPGPAHGDTKPKPAGKFHAPLRASLQSGFAAILRLSSPLARKMNNPVAWFALAAAVAAAVLCAVVLSVQTTYGTVKIELSDPAAKVAVKVDGDTIDIVGLKDPIRLKAGDHQLEVESGDYKSVSKSFSVLKDNNEILRVTLDPKEKAVGKTAVVVAETKPKPDRRPDAASAEAASDPFGSAAGKAAAEGSPPPLAVAPFDAAQAKAHQAAWAKQLGMQVEMTNSIGTKLVLVPPGKFTMGSPASESGHQSGEEQVSVTISRAFYLGKCGITKTEFIAVMGTTPWAGKESVKEGKDYPATYVDWNDANEFCRKLTERESQAGSLPHGYRYAMPTEAQREYACRAGTTTAYSFGDDPSVLGDYAWYDKNADDAGEKYAHRAGQKKPNPWGLYDVHGNVYEWCCDFYVEKRPGGTDPFVGTGSGRVLRGGCWRHFAGDCRSALRGGGDPSWRSSFLGFRLALVPSSELDSPAVVPNKESSGVSARLDAPSRPATAAVESPPPLGVAPFDAAQAKAHQAAWAKQLGMQVEMTNSIGTKLVLVPPGKFTMGSPVTEKDRDKDDEDQVSVTISKAFYLGRCSVTQAEFKTVMGTTPWSGNVLVKEGDDYPATYVDWNDANEFCRKLTERESQVGGLPHGYRYSLPTEAQREYACRAGTTTAYSFGEDASDLADYAWYDKNADDAGESYAHRAGQKKPNPWGLYDMHGNVWEWCRDFYGGKLPGGTDPFVGTGSSRVLRGGSWLRLAGSCRSALRGGDGPSLRGRLLGFRLALVPSSG